MLFVFKRVRYFSLKHFSIKTSRIKETSLSIDSGNFGKYREVA